MLKLCRSVKVKKVKLCVFKHFHYAVTNSAVTITGTDICHKKTISVSLLSKYCRILDPAEMSVANSCHLAAHDNEDDKNKIKITCNMVPSTPPISDDNDMDSKSTNKTNKEATTHVSAKAEKLHKPVSNRAEKRRMRAEQYKQLKKKRKKENLIQTGREEAGYNLEEFDQTSYYFENGLRKVYPYYYVFTTYAKGRWVGRALKEVLEREFGFDQPEDLDRAFHNGKIHVNNVQVSVDYVVKDCDYISHQIHRHENPVSDSAIEVLADTKDVVVINKPSSWPCHPCGRYRFNSVVFILGKEMGYCNLRNIYRVDRLTSGVLVLGKTAEYSKILEDQVVNRQVQKEYVCRVEGEFPSETLTVDQPLQAVANKLRLQVVSPTGKKSQTTFTRLSYNGRSSVVQCLPHTGRTHQIRVHLQYLGYPIVNDVFYNSNAWGPNKAKGGIYQVPHDVVCSRILQVHHKTKWDGGENPLFHQKLKEMETRSNCGENVSANDAAYVKDGAQIQSSSQQINATDKERGDSLSISKDSVVPVLKTDNKSDDSTHDKLPLSADTKESDLSVAPEQNDAKTDCGHSHSPGKLESNSSDSVGKTHHHPHASFEWSKWNIDPSCPMCKMTIIEPENKDLVMFLHALKYKGPGWEYETKLPDWAREDWAEEEKYLLEQWTPNDEEHLEQTTKENAV